MQSLAVAIVPAVGVIVAVVVVQLLWVLESYWASQHGVEGFQWNLLGHEVAVLHTVEIEVVVLLFSFEDFFLVPLLLMVVLMLVLQDSLFLL